MMRTSVNVLAGALGIAVLCGPAMAQERNLVQWLSQKADDVLADRPKAVSLPPTARMEVAFSPDGQTEDLVVKVIDSASVTLRVAAYSFTSKPVAMALIRAHKRGVDVKVVVDKSQRTERYTAANFVANQGIPVRIDDMHPIMHSKFVVADSRTVETGSFNYSANAKRNGENVLVIWERPELARNYEQDWTSHWQHSETLQPRY